MLNKDFIFQTYPLLIPSTDEKYLVIGDDLDSYLSASLFIKYNPNTKIIGFYEGLKKLYLRPDYKKILSKTLWIDLDIYNEQCNSLGHHVVRYSLEDKLEGFKNSCNFNELLEDKRCYTYFFGGKCPMNTVLMLCDLYDESYEPKRAKEMLLWLADSVYENTKKFTGNVKEWVEKINNIMITNSFYDDIFNNTEQFKKELQKRKHVTDDNFQFKHNFDLSFLEQTGQLISSITHFPNFYEHLDIKEPHIIIGERKHLSFGKVKNFDLFLKSQNIFSYVFPDMTHINYTLLDLI